MNLGGSSAVANELSKQTGKDISRQQIHTWWKRRERNGFPEGSIGTHVTATGKSLQSRQFDIDEVINWFRSYTPNRGGRPHTKIDAQSQVYDEAVVG